MFFPKSLVAAAALCLSLSLQAHAHAAISPALGVQGTPARSDVQRPSTAKPCGKINIAQTIDSSTAVTAAANGSFAATITNFNAGTDGSTQVTAQVDATGTGKSFVNAEVLQNGVKSPKTTGSVQLVVQMPAGTTCTGGATGDKCLVTFKTAGGFGNCVVVQQGAAAGGNAAAAGTAAAGTSASGTDTTGTNGTAVASSASSAAAAATSTTTTTGKKHKGNKANQAQQAAANPQAAKFKAFLESLRQNNANKSVGTRAARIARRAAERPAVEVLA
ncbi:hypothetical protein L226DRAFT_570836 [Lentinus tigrinus ALCF2SS1-7]|uniref:Uncharacterized protein n=1 Tax=Lentinus tigrinus ALCF2SS1-6 TaxID=1328759 RepID=A0A5C2SI81_9APHY|nr:hypothetical protein L227DRAFT_75971 [Lentinus tigrinus ALCF2SS1-6]RPD75176.1 hypothetical protein L226DRAFT_570836 [Lentinus tigrinus ALCF2SS1-7]